MCVKTAGFRSKKNSRFCPSGLGSFRARSAIHARRVSGTLASVLTNVSCFCPPTFKYSLVSPGLSESKSRDRDRDIVRGEELACCQAEEAAMFGDDEAVSAAELSVMSDCACS